MLVDVLRSRCRPRRWILKSLVITVVEEEVVVMLMLMLW